MLYRLQKYATVTVISIHYKVFANKDVLTELVKFPCFRYNKKLLPPNKLECFDNLKYWISDLIMWSVWEPFRNQQLLWSLAFQLCISRFQPLVIFAKRSILNVDRVLKKRYLLFSFNKTSIFSSHKNHNFYCGVLRLFYARPTAEM